MQKEKGNVSVTTENIFPIIRQWLYSDRDIFLRELVSNASDAIEKLRRLVGVGETTLPEDEAYAVHVRYDKKKGVLSVEDNGIGMTADEVKKYINQIAFSGAMDFVEKYKNKNIDTAGIIGHFGLGFYSAFMVADSVRIDTRSWQPDAEAVHWLSKDGIAYEMGESDRTERGSVVTLQLSDDGKELMEKEGVESILRKYCAFMPYPIYFVDVAEEKKADKKKKADSEETAEEESAPKPVNETSPLWLKAPKDCTDEEYKAFYRDTFMDFREPLFWIHLNMDYPFNLKGILYFPRTDNSYESLEGRIKVFYNQVFVADNVKEILPEFLFLLRGCVDCPDLPLNVSRSFLQNDSYVQKLSQHIIRKVADKLQSLFESDRDAYAGYWKDIGVFVKYGCLRDEKFYDRVKDVLLFPSVGGGFRVMSELNDKTLYTPDPRQQVVYINRAKEKGLQVAILDHELDNHFMSFIEYKNKDIHFLRVDASLEGETANDDQELLQSLETLFRKATGDEKLKLKMLAMGADALPALIEESEESRRMEEMRKQFQRMSPEGGGTDDLFPVDLTLVLNTDHPAVARLRAADAEEERVQTVARHLYDMARLGHGTLDADGMAAFLARSATLLGEWQV
ncbi:MAG: molecular chaperone HtpG [Clostridiaceae bacterium]|nr:molecular chaperone HtpG [Clostridiaceae bacterium]